MPKKQDSNIGELESSLEELTKESKQLEKATVCELKKSGRIDDEEADDSEEEVNTDSVEKDEIDETEVETIETKEEYKNDPGWTAKPRKKKKNWLLILLNIFLAVNAMLLIAFISAILTNTGNAPASVGKSPAVPDGDIIEYINESDPKVSVNDIEVSVAKAEFDEDEGILALDYTVRNNGDETVRFLSSSFRIAFDEGRSVVPILAGDINENDVNTADGIKPGESVVISLKYGVTPGEIEGNEIKLKGIFSSIDGTYDISYDVPKVNHQ